jgi:cell division protein FtsL
MATARVARSPHVNPRRERSDRDRHLRVVGPGRATWLRLSPRAGGVLTVHAIAAHVAVAVSHVLLIERQARVDDLDAQVAEKQARYEQLSLEVAQLRSPGRIRSAAVEELGMVPAGDVVWLTPDEPVPPSDDPPPEADDSPDTSAARVKPYLEAAP